MQITITNPDAKQFTTFETLQPKTAATDDLSSVELGTACTLSQAGTVTGMRFYEGTGIRERTRARSKRRRTPDPSDVQQFNRERLADCHCPVPPLSRRRHVISYLAPNGRYAYTPVFFADT